MVESAKTDQIIASLHPKKPAQKRSYQTRRKSNESAANRGAQHGGGRGGRGTRGAGGSRGGFNRGRGVPNKGYESFSFPPPLKVLNCFILFERFKIEGLCTVRESLRQGDWVAKVDFKDVYLTVPMNSAFLPLLRFIWRGRILQYTYLPFGLLPAPRFFTKLLKVVVTFLRERGIRLLLYLDYVF